MFKKDFIMTENLRRGNVHVKIGIHVDQCLEKNGFADYCEFKLTINQSSDPRTYPQHQ